MYDPSPLLVEEGVFYWIVHNPMFIARIRLSITRIAPFALLFGASLNSSPYLYKQTTNHSIQYLFI